MKKLILISCVMLVALNGFAQSIVPSYKQTPKFAPKFNLQGTIDNDQHGQSFYNFSNPNTENAPYGSNSRSAVTKIKFSSSWNMFGVLTSYQQCLTGDYDLNMISFTHRQCASYPGNSGLIQTSFSLDGGSTWDTTLVIQNDSSEHGRYPSGGIYNPAGNTDPNNAFAVISGPITDGTAWIANYFCSSQLNGTNNDQQYEVNGNSGVTFQHMARIGFTTTAQAKAYVLGSDYDFNQTTGIIPFNGMILNTGSFNSGTNKFDWNRQKLAIAFSHDPADGSQNFGNLGQIAFSADGMTGYIVQLGRDSVLDYNYNQPLIYKTTDAGANWVYQTPYNFSTLTSLTQYVKPSWDGTVTAPVFTTKNGLDLLVDNNNNLHIVCQIEGAFSTNPDSLNYIWNDSLFNQMFDIYQTSTGWDAYMIDTIQTEPVYAALSPWSGGTGSTGLTWDGRIQASMNEARTKMFYTWLDTDPEVDQNNTFPNIYSKAFDMVAQKEAGPFNFTPQGSPYNGNNFWLFVSDKVITNGGTYEVPATTTQSQTIGDDGSGPVNHYFVQGITFSDIDFYPLSSPVISDATSFKVSQNMPNPAKGVTSFDINLTTPSSVKVEVSNLLGQTMISLPVQHLKTGINTVNLNIQNLSAGIYFYTVTVGTDKVTHKMIVE